MRYPFFGWTGQTIGITALSSGLPDALHPLLEESKLRLEDRQMETVIGETVWTQEKAQSTTASVRASELMQMFQHPDIDAILPPFGGERALDILSHLDFFELPVKWLLGYSDTSTVLFAITVKTGIATAHGPNVLELRSEEWDETTAAWRRVLATPRDGSVTQWMSTRFQTAWNHDVRPKRFMFHFDQPTEWKTLNPSITQVTGRLLGGCLETVRHLIGTPYGDVRAFQEQHLGGEPILWYFEACEASATDLHRSLMQMHLAGWFDYATGILFGRTSAGQAIEDYTLLDVYQMIATETGLPIFYDLDIGHQPPQLTLVNGATATVTLQGKDSRLDMTFD